MTIAPRFVGRAARDRVGMRLFVVLSAGAGIGLVVVGVCTGAWRTLPVGGVLLANAASLHLSLFGRRRPGKRLRETWGADGVEIRVGLRPHRPLALLCTALSLTMVFGGCLLLVESPAGRLLMWVLLPLPLLLVPDSVRGLLARGREVVLTPRALIYRGWSFDIDVPWDDVVAVGLDKSNPQLVCARVDLRPTPTARVVRHKILIWLEPKPRPDRLQIPVLGLDGPAPFVALAGFLARAPVSTRSTFLARYGRATMLDALPELPELPELPTA